MYLFQPIRGAILAPTAALQITRIISLILDMDGVGLLADVLDDPGPVHGDAGENFIYRE